METKKMQVADNLEVDIILDDKCEFLMTTSEVAKGYGISPNTLRRHKMEHIDELKEGKHFISSVHKTNARCKSDGYIQTKQTLWTKRGIVRLGFFIKSERSIMFRDWAEDLVINTMEQAQQITQDAQQLNLFPEPPKKRNINCLTKDRLVDVLADVARIDDKELRMSIVYKLMNNK